MSTDETKKPVLNPLERAQQAVQDHEAHLKQLQDLQKQMTSVYVEVAALLSVENPQLLVRAMFTGELPAQAGELTFKQATKEIDAHIGNVFRAKQRAQDRLAEMQRKAAEEIVRQTQELARSEAPDYQAGPPDPVPSNCGMDPSAPVERPQQPMTTGVTELTAEQVQRLAPDSRVAEPLVE